MGGMESEVLLGFGLNDRTEVVLRDEIGEVLGVFEFLLPLRECHNPSIDVVGSGFHLTRVDGSRCEIVISRLSRFETQLLHHDGGILTMTNVWEFIHSTAG